jgi:NADPH:quinone reductase-like Zn-dependent oxidoreductase
VSDEQGAMTLVNPLTALEFIATAKRGRHRAVISNAAASSLGRMIEYLAGKEKLGVINIVRSNEKADFLKQCGSKHVLISSSQGFETELRDLAAATGATLLLDPVCSSELNKMISALPNGSKVVVYGNLTGEEYIQVNPRELIDRNINVSGFYLANTAASNGMLKNMINLLKAGKLMAGGMESKVRVRYRINEAQEAVDSYLSAMSEGKVLIVPGWE